MRCKSDRGSEIKLDYLYIKNHIELDQDILIITLKYEHYT